MATKIIALEQLLGGLLHVGERLLGTALFSTSYLAKRRIAGDGPSFLKIGRRVFYTREDLDTWREARRRHSTSEDWKTAQRG